MYHRKNISLCFSFFLHSPCCSPEAEPDTRESRRSLRANMWRHRPPVWAFWFCGRTRSDAALSHISACVCPERLQHTTIAKCLSGLDEAWVKFIQEFRNLFMLLVSYPASGGCQPNVYPPWLTLLFSVYYKSTSWQ